MQSETTRRNKLGSVCDAEMEGLFNEIRNTFDASAQSKVLERVHEKFVDDALFLMVIHDVNARAMSPKVKGFVQAQNWFQNFSSISISP
jgi:peptide/nickel transport system substrate-binding protein